MDDTKWMKWIAGCFALRTAGPAPSIHSRSMPPHSLTSVVGLRLKGTHLMLLSAAVCWWCWGDNGKTLTVGE